MMTPLDLEVLIGKDLQNLSEPQRTLLESFFKILGWAMSVAPTLSLPSVSITDIDTVTFEFSRLSESHSS